MIDAKRLAELMEPEKMRGLAEFLAEMCGKLVEYRIGPESASTVEHIQFIDGLDCAAAVLREVAGMITPKLLAISDRLKTQDNRATAEPMFCLQEKRRDYGYDPQWTDDTVWLFDHEEVPEGTEEAVETGYKDTWHTVMVAFTEGACEAYQQQNKHRHGELRIYVKSFYRNYEMIDIRAWLMSLATAEDRKE